MLIKLDIPRAGSAWRPVATGIGAVGILCLAVLALAPVATRAQDAEEGGVPPIVRTGPAAEAASGSREAARSRRVLLLAAGQPTGVGFAVAGAAARVIDDQAPVTGLRAAVQATTGSMESIIRLSAGEFDLALVGAEWVADARAGEGVFSGQPAHEALRVVAPIYPEVLTVMVRAHEGIGELDDLAGLRINFGPADAPSRPLFERALIAAGVGLDPNGTRAELPLALQGQALCLGEVDAIAYIAAHPSGTVRNVAMSCPVAFLPITGALADQMRRDEPMLVPAEIPAGFYPGTGEGVASIGRAVLLAATGALEEAGGYAVARAVYEQFPLLCAQVPVFAGCDPSFMLERAALPAPLHDGADRFFATFGPAPVASEEVGE